MWEVNPAFKVQMWKHSTTILHKHVQKQITDKWKLNFGKYIHPCLLLQYDRFNDMQTVTKQLVKQKEDIHEINANNISTFY